MNITAEPFVVNETISFTLYDIKTTNVIDFIRPVRINNIEFKTVNDIYFTLTPYLYVVDSGNNRVQVFDYDGNFKFSFGSYGTGNGQFDNPFGVATDGDYVYVTDTGNARIQIFDAYGNYISQFQTQGLVKGIAADERFLYVIDQQNDNLLIYSKDGNLLFTYGDGATCEDCLNDPTYVQVDFYYIYIDDTGNNRTVTLSKNIYFPNNLYAVLPTPDASFTGYCNSINLDITLPDFSLDFIINSNDVAGMNIVIPTADFSASMGGRLNIQTPALDSVFSAIIGESADIDIILPDITIDLSTHNTNYGSFEVEIPPVKATFKTQTGEIGNLEIVIPNIIYHLGSKFGSSAQLSIEIPPALADLYAVTGNIIDLNIKLPYIYTEFYGNSISAAIDYKAIAVNTITSAVTEYTNFNFNSITEYKGKYLTASDKGIYLLEEDKDDNTNITANFKTGTFDGYANIVRVPYECWVKGRKGSMVLDYILDESQTFSYSVSPQSTSIRGTQVKLPKGARGRYTAYNLKNVNGSDFKIQSFKIMTHNIAKKVR